MPIRATRLKSKFINGYSIVVIKKLVEILWLFAAPLENKCHQYKAHPKNIGAIPNTIGANNPGK